MILTLSKKEIGEAVIEYLQRRGIETTPDQLFVMGATPSQLEIEVRNIKLVPKEGPYR